MSQDWLSNSSPLTYSANTYDNVGMPIFYSGSEFELRVRMGRELVENLIKQDVLLYRIDAPATESNFYGESKKKQFLDPVAMQARVAIVDQDVLLEGGIRKLKRGDMELHVYNEHLVEIGVDNIKVGDFIKFEHKFYEVFDNGPNDDANIRRLGVDREYYRTIRAHFVESGVFSGR